MVVDVGTGDGRSVLALARHDSSTLAVGIDADAASMADSSRRAARRDALPNALFAVAAAEALPPELSGCAERVTVHFPWGSLLRGLARGEPNVAGQIAAVATDAARVEVLLSARPADRLPRLEAVEASTVAAVAANFEPHAFRLAGASRATAAEIAAVHSSWAKRLGANGERIVWRVSLER